MTRKKESPPKCPKCGSIETKKSSHILGGLIEQRVGENGRVGYSDGAKEITRVVCADCGTELKNHPDHIPDVVKEMKEAVKEALEQYKE